MTLTEKERLARNRLCRARYYAANREKLKAKRRQYYLAQRGDKWHVELEEFEKAVHIVLDRQTSRPRSIVNLYQLMHSAMSLVGIPRRSGGLYRALNDIAKRVVLTRGGVLWPIDSNKHLNRQIYEFVKESEPK